MSEHGPLLEERDDDLSEDTEPNVCRPKHAIALAIGVVLCSALGLGLFFILAPSSVAAPAPWPVVINTWPFVNATQAAWITLTQHNGSAVDAVEAGSRKCQSLRCDGSVGWGGSPNGNGVTTLDALIMNSTDAGAVAALHNIRDVVGVARMVMEHTTHTLLVGSEATDFAVQFGFPLQNLSSPESVAMYEKWLHGDPPCQPNYYKGDNLTPDPRTHCPPFHVNGSTLAPTPSSPVFGLGSGSASPGDGPMPATSPFGPDNHDTIGIVSVDAHGRLACATSTNGATFKIPGRVGDSPIPGSGCFAADDAGAACTGDGDVMMRYAPALQIVLLIRSGLPPEAAAQDVIRMIGAFNPTFSGACVALRAEDASHGAATWNMAFSYCARSANDDDVKVITVTPSGP